MRPHLIVTALLLAGTCAGTAFGAESAYTDVDLENCQNLSAPVPAGEPDGSVSWRCKGYGAYPMYFKEGDLRQSVNFGHLAPEIVDGAFESFGGFNHIGAKVEWRLDASGEPYAAILRYFIENANPETGAPDKSYWGQVLVVYRVGRLGDDQGCVVGYVDALANAEPNVLARDVADDVAKNFACGSDKARFHGTKGEKSGDPTSYIPGPGD
jgi:hypothetical protein